MNPRSTQRFRRVTALLAIVWALCALIIGVRGQVAFQRSPSPPFSFSAVAGRAVVHGVTPAAREAGIDSGDRLLAIDGAPVAQWIRDGRWRLRVGEPNTYRVARSSGTSLEVALPPIPPGARAFPVEGLFAFLIPAVGA